MQNKDLKKSVEQEEEDKNETKDPLFLEYKAAILQRIIFRFPMKTSVILIYNITCCSESQLLSLLLRMLNTMGPY